MPIIGLEYHRINGQCGTEFVRAEYFTIANKRLQRCAI